MILGLYKIEYPDKGFVQYKVMISDEEYQRIKLIEDEDEYKKALKDATGGKQWFTDKSAYHNAISTGIISNYGEHKVIITKIEDHGKSGS